MTTTDTISPIPPLKEPHPATHHLISPPTSPSQRWEPLLNCPPCDFTFISHIDLVYHLRIHRTVTVEPVPGVPTHCRARHIHCSRAFTHRMGIFGHMRIHDSGIHHNVDSTDAPRTTSAPAILTATANPATTKDNPQPLSTSPAPAISLHASTWSVICEYFARRQANQCLGL
ncbi:unnamed protein product [Schistocephalus solidus]|uniref:C2H2-type domain-containing protein n=1 Tax=Schistocephalus solidus TaxID=70667 RepID=A0A183SVT9_SCHSO|nr:unnamed protein product [Schistocephalus solidus]